ncbi:hypothetical protein [Propionivibrio sp.]|uniref:hypothetical protein n=1 Tax=Propionivibrio sp. TaxID=2212460 RepID=UPI0025FE332C|nr:hypothetical protein [Propionivibrio sp.]
MYSSVAEFGLDLVILCLQLFVADRILLDEFLDIGADVNSLGPHRLARDVSFLVHQLSSPPGPQFAPDQFLANRVFSSGVSGALGFLFGHQRIGQILRNSSTIDGDEGTAGDQRRGRDQRTRRSSVDASLDRFCMWRVPSV